MRIFTFIKKEVAKYKIITLQRQITQQYKQKCQRGILIYFYYYYYYYYQSYFMFFSYKPFQVHPVVIQHQFVYNGIVVNCKESVSEQERNKYLQNSTFEIGNINIVTNESTNVILYFSISCICLTLSFFVLQCSFIFIWDLTVCGKLVNIYTKIMFLFLLLLLLLPKAISS